MTVLVEMGFRFRDLSSGVCHGSLASKYVYPYSSQGPLSIISSANRNPAESVSCLRSLSLLPCQCPSVASVVSESFEAIRSLRRPQPAPMLTSIASPGRNLLFQRLLLSSDQNFLRPMLYYSSLVLRRREIKCNENSRQHSRSSRYLAPAPSRKT